MALFYLATCSIHLGQYPDGDLVGRVLQQVPAEDRTGRLAGYLLAASSEESVWSDMGRPVRVCAAAYVMALRALAEGNLKPAYDLLQVAMDSKYHRSVAYKWGRTDLLSLAALPRAPALRPLAIRALPSALPIRHEL